MIFMLKIKNALAHRKSLKTKNWRHYLMKTEKKLKAELTESLGVDDTMVLRRFKALGIIQKQRHWVPNELKPRRRTASCHVWTVVSMAEKERFIALYRDWRWKVALKSGFNMITLSVEDCRVSPAIHQHGQQSRISMGRSFCTASGEISWVLLIMSRSNWRKQSRQIAIDYYWCVWADHWSKNGRYTSRDATKWFCNMTTLGHMFQNGWKPT